MGVKMFRLQDCIVFTSSNRSRIISEAFNDMLGKQGSTRVQWTALYFIATTPGINQSKLSEQMHIKSSTVVRLVERMLREGLIQKEPLAYDRRNSILSCTEKGKSMYAQLLPLDAEFEERLCKDITAEELHLFDRIYAKLAQNAKEIQSLA